MKTTAKAKLGKVLGPLLRGLLSVVIFGASGGALAAAEGGATQCATFSPSSSMTWRNDQLSEVRASRESEIARPAGFSFDLLSSIQVSYSSRQLIRVYKLQSPQGGLIAVGHYGRDLSSEFVRVFDCRGILLGTWREVFMGDALRWQVMLVLENSEGEVLAQTEVFRHLAGRFVVVDQASGSPWLKVDDALSSSPKLELQSQSEIDPNLIPFSLLFQSKPKNFHL